MVEDKACMNSALSLVAIEKKPTKIEYSTQPLCNIRDVFLLNFLDFKTLQNRWFRGGSLNNISPKVVERFASVVSFCAEPDTPIGSAAYYHCPFPNDLDIYDISSSKTCQWITSVITCLATVKLPCYFHCFAGKDRTGIIAAALQLMHGIPCSYVLYDYSNSDGELHVPEFTVALQYLHDVFVPSISRATISSIIEKPVAFGLRGGYLPRHLTITNGYYKWCSDSNGRLKQIRSSIVYNGGTATDLWPRRFSVFDMTPLRAMGYKWVQAIPFCFGGHDTLFNEIMLHRAALDAYRSYFNKLRQLNQICYVEISFTYFPNVIEGVSRPDLIEIRRFSDPMYEILIEEESIGNYLS